MRFQTLTYSVTAALLVAAQPACADERNERYTQSVPSSVAAEIGKLIFLDTSLSQPRGQGCVSCHRPESAFADARRVSPGAVEGRVGKRNSPSLMYAALIPGFVYEDLLTGDGVEVFVWEGGLFHDGRARDLFEQVQQPFFDPNEMNLPNEAALAERLRTAQYAGKFQNWIGRELWRDDSQVNYHAYRALVEFLREPMFRPFDARIDDYLAGNKNALAENEKRGLKVFSGDGKCSDCHFLEPTTWSKPLLSDFGYDNLGVPSRGEKDPGLGSRKGPEELGKFRAPSLRNVAITAPYMHNGSLATLRDVMEFYNRRDVEPKRWGPTDYPDTVNHTDLGKLQLNEKQVTDLVALMHAFTDRSLLQPKAAPQLPQSRSSTPTIQEKRMYFPGWTHRLYPCFPSVIDASLPGEKE